MSSQHKSFTFITTYPQKFHVNGGVATATKKLLDAWSRKYPQDRLNVIAEEYTTEEEFKEESQNVYRIWVPNNLLSFWRILTRVLRLGRQPLFLQLELSIYGTPLYTALLVFTIGLLRLLNWPTYIVLHQVILDITTLAGHVGIKRHSLRGRLYNGIFLPMFYRLCAMAARKIVVFEPELKNRLAAIKIRNVALVPHGVDNKSLSASTETIADWRSYYDITPKQFVVTIFGFIAWYKGHDLFIKTIERLAQNPNIHVIIAGGESPSQRNHPIYEKYYKRVIRAASKLPNVIVTGFIPDNSIGKMMQISDLMVFPYRAMMSSSGPLAITIAYQKPFLVSKNLSPIFESPEFAGLSEEVKRAMVFSHSTHLADKILEVAEHPEQLEKLENAAKQIKKARIWENLIDNYRDIN